MIEYSAGIVTAYGSAVRAGYTGTYEDFCRQQAQYAENAQAVEQAKQDAQTARNQAQTAKDDAVTAKNNAVSAKDDAVSAKNTAVSAKDDAVSAKNTATTKAQEASQSATNAGQSATSAEASARASAQSADDAEQSAQSVSGSLAQIQTNKEDIDTLKADLDDLTDATAERIQSEPITETISATFTDGAVDVSGNITASTSYHYTQKLSVKPGDVFATNGMNIRIVTAYNGDSVVPEKGVLSETNTYTVPDGIDGIILTLKAAATTITKTYVEYTLVNSMQYLGNAVVRYDETQTLTDAQKTTARNNIGLNNILSDIDNRIDTIANVTVETVSAITQTVIGANLIDKTLAVTGAINNAGNIDISGSGSNYKTSDYIPIFANKTYTLYYANSTGQSQAKSRLIYLLYDTEKSAGTYVNQNNVSNLTISPTEDGYIRVATVDDTTHPYFSDLLMLIEGTTIIPYEDYKNEKYLSDDINPINGKAVAYFDSRFALDGKKWAHCGDSASDYTNATFRNGRFIGKYKTFPRLIAERNHMTLLQDFMLGGRTLAYPSDGTFHNSLCDPEQTYYYQNIPNDTDYITIMLGGNDCQHTGSGTTTDGEDATGAITLGTISDGDPATEGTAPTYSTATYYGAYNAVCYWLRVNRPYAHVGIVIENMTRRPDYTAAQIAIAKKWGYPYINLNGDERTPTMIRSTNSDVPSWIKDLIMTSQSVNAPSDTHPNWQTHELESRLFEAWLRSI